MTFTNLNREVNRLAHALHGLGLQAGDRIVMSLANRPEVYTVFFAAQKIGAVAVLLNYNLTIRELAVIGADCAPKIWFYDERTGEALVDAAKTLPAVEHWISCGCPSVERSTTYGTLINRASDGEPPTPNINIQSPSLIMYTSGTTGRPKGVVLSHAAQWINTVLMIAELGFRATDRTLQIAPLYHVAAFHVIGLPIMFVGGSNVIVEKFDPEIIAEMAEACGITSILGAPTHFELWAEHGNVSSSRVRQILRHVIITGAAANTVTVDWILNRVSRQLWNVYGQTEASSLITVAPPHEIHRMAAVNCIGRPLLGMDVTHIPVESSVVEGLSRAQPPSRGELIARGPKLMNCYYNAPDKTAEAIEEGWLRTGDLVENDGDGFYYYLGRVDDMIVTGGENVYPVEVEEVLLTCPGIVDCVVLGLPDHKWGQLITAYIVSDPKKFVLSEAKKLANQQLAPHKRPRRWKQIQRIPRSASGKILVRELTAGQDQLAGGR